MSAAYEGQDPIAIAKQAERDLNSQGAKQEHRVDDTARHAAGASDSSMFLCDLHKHSVHQLTQLSQPSSLVSTSPLSPSSPVPK